MKVLRTLAAITFLLGSVYVITSIFMLLNVNQLLEMSGVMPDDTDQAFYQRFLIATIALLISGVTSAAGSVGLFMVREWGRKSWPFIAALTVLGHVLWFILDLFRGSVEPADWLTLAAITLIYVAPTVYLMRPTTKALFQRRAVDAT